MPRSALGGSNNGPGRHHHRGYRSVRFWGEVYDIGVTYSLI